MTVLSGAKERRTAKLTLKQRGFSKFPSGLLLNHLKSQESEESEVSMNKPRELNNMSSSDEEGTTYK